MQRLEVSGAVRPLYWSSGVKGLRLKIRDVTLTKNNSENSKLDIRVFEIKFLIYRRGYREIPTC